MKKMKRLLFLALMAVAISCSKSDPAPETDAKNEYFGTQSPGDAWTAAFLTTRGTFILVWDNGTSLVSTDDVTIQGTYTKLTNGYTKMIVNSVAPAKPAIPSDGSFIIYAIEIPGRSLMMLPPQSSRMAVITMSAVSTRTGTNGVHKFNYVRTAFPSSSAGYDHIDGSECWGKYEWKINEADGAVSLNSGNIARSLNCAEADFNPNVACSGNQDNSVPTNTVLGKMDEFGRFVQVNPSAGEPVFKGQFTINKGMFVLDSGDGHGGMFMLEEDAVTPLSAFMGSLLIGFESYHTRIGNSSDYTLLQGGARLHLFQPDSAAMTSYNDIGTDDIKSTNSFGIKFKQMDKGIVKGYFWSLDADNHPLNKYPFVGLTYNRDGKQMIVLVSGRKTGSGLSTVIEQWVYHFVLN